MASIGIFLSILRYPMFMFQGKSLSLKKALFIKVGLTIQLFILNKLQGIATNYNTIYLDEYFFCYQKIRLFFLTPVTVKINHISLGLLHTHALFLFSNFSYNYQILKLISQLFYTILRQSKHQLIIFATI